MKQISLPEAPLNLGKGLQVGLPGILGIAVDSRVVRQRRLHRCRRRMGLCGGAEKNAAVTTSAAEECAAQDTWKNHTTAATKTHSDPF